MPRGLILPADFQSMGFGVPAAIGASLAHPARRVVAVVGDGGLAMSAMELLTAARERVPVVVVVMNDGFLNLIRLQELGDGATSAVTLRNPDFRLLARACGVGFARVDGDPRETISWALQQDCPVLVEVLVGDSPAIARLRAVGVARSAARKMLGRRGLDRLRWLIAAINRR
jgi:thiamine pyrophosphate-dependent acetolactate synthase large subunit-like protein